jgi:hypothetical protein
MNFIKSEDDIYVDSKIRWEGIMRIGSIVVFLYWAIFTIRMGFTPKLASSLEANAYDRNGRNEEAKKTAQRWYYPLKAAKWILKIVKWIETVLLVLLIAVVFYVLGAIMIGVVVVPGY